jgi:hypothetical protein
MVVSKKCEAKRFFKLPHYLEELRYLRSMFNLGASRE